MAMPCGSGMVLLVAVAAIKIASNPGHLVLELVGIAWAGFGAAFGPVVLISVLWKGMTRNGALAGMLVGALTVLVWKYSQWLGLNEMIPGQHRHHAVEPGWQAAVSSHVGAL